MTLQQVFSDITRDKQIARSMFMSVPTVETTFIRLLFQVDGTVKVSDEFGDEFAISPIQFGFTPTIELYEDSEKETVAYRLAFTYKGKDYQVLVYFKFNVDPYKVKVTITGILPIAGQIKIPFSSVKQRILKEKSVWFGTLGAGRESHLFLTGVCFDWNDVLTGATFDDVNNQMAFNADTTFTVDPTVGTSTNSYPLTESSQKKCFYANGRWWAWYYNGSYFGWETSTDGTTWTGSFTNYSSLAPSRHDIWYDEVNNKICIARVTGSSSSGVYYRQGTANSDGTITWDSAEVVVCSDNYTYQPKVCKDSGGYPWISYLGTTSNYERVVKATATDGSAWGTPTTLWTNRASGNEAISIIPLTNNRMMAISVAIGYKVQSRLYDGSSWESAVDASSSNANHFEGFDAVNDGDNAHLVFLRQTSLDVLYVKYTYGTGWGSEETVEASSSITLGHPSMSFKDANKIRVFYFSSATTIKYRDRDAGSWQSAVTISSSEVSMTCLTSSYKAVSSRFCVMWKSGASSPYDVKIETYTLGQLYEIYVDAITQSLATPTQECTLNISKDAAVTSQALHAPETTFNISKEAVAQALASAVVEVVTGVIEIFKDAVVTASATPEICGVYLIDVDAVVEASSLTDLRQTLNISPEATVKVLAEVTVVKEAEVKVTRLFLLVGNLAIQLTGD